MQSRIFCVLILGLVLNVPQAFSGVASSGGAKSIVCRDYAGLILSATLLDLYEAEAVHGLTLDKNPEERGRAAIYAGIINEMNRINGESVRPISEIQSFFDLTVKSLFKFIDPPEMEDLNDLGNVGLTPVGCSLEQTAIYDDKKRSVAVNQEIWNALDETNKAALLLHEILYADYRRSGDTTSQNIRKIVAYLFSTAEKPSIKDELPSDHYICNSGNYSGDTNGSNFYLYFDGQGHTIIRFKKLMGRNTYMPIETMIPVVIDLSRLEQMSIDGKNTLVSRDQTVDFDEARSLEGGLFSGYNLRIRYQANEQFYLSFIDPTGIVLQHNPVISCYKPRQPL